MAHASAFWKSRVTWAVVVRRSEARSLGVPKRLLTGKRCKVRGVLGWGLQHGQNCEMIVVMLHIMTA